MAPHRQAVSESGLNAQADARTRFKQAGCLSQTLNCQAGGHPEPEMQHRPDHSPIQPITSPRAREESMPTLFEFAALFVVLFLTIYW